MCPIDPDDFDDFDDFEEYEKPEKEEDMAPRDIQTAGGRLRKFHKQFDSSVRAKLQDCLYREIEENGKLILQILCPNEAVFKRLARKHQKIRTSVKWIWLEKMDEVALCVETKDGLHCQNYDAKHPYW